MTSERRGMAGRGITGLTARTGTIRTLVRENCRWDLVGSSEISRVNALGVRWDSGRKTTDHRAAPPSLPSSSLAMALSPKLQLRVLWRMMTVRPAKQELRRPSACPSWSLGTRKTVVQRRDFLKGLNRWDRW